MHVVAGGFDDLALALAARAGADVDHLPEHRLAHAADLATTVALRAGDRIHALLGAAPLAGRAAEEDRELDLLLGAVDRFLERQAQVVAQVGARLRPAAARRIGRAGPAEEGIEDVAEPAEALEARATRAAGAVHPGRAEHVVALTLLRIGEDLVGLVDLLELLLRLGRGVDVRVPLLGELAEGALQLGVGRAALDTQDLVAVTFCGRHRSRRIREVARGHRARRAGRAGQAVWRPHTTGGLEQPAKRAASASDRSSSGPRTGPVVSPTVRHADLTAAA